MARSRDALREIATAIWRAGVEAVGGGTSVHAALRSGDIARPDRVLAVGKAAVPMAVAALAHFGTRIPALAVTKYGHGLAPGDDRPGGFEIIEASHPVPDENSLRAGAALLAAVRDMQASQSLLLLVSGGASALAEVPVEGFSLDDVRKENARLLAGGLDIHAINARRREFSRIKGGGLLSGFRGSRVDVLAVSDVAGDDIAVIGSGIGACPPNPDFACHTRTVASNAIARQAAEARARASGFSVVANDETLYGDVAEVARRLGKTIRAQPSGVAIHGGEPTVVLPERPREGGRNQALATALAREISGMDDICVLVAGTDGTDGPTLAAGGIVDGGSWRRVEGGEEALARADSGAWLERAGCRFVTGPTGTNVMDLMVVVRAGGNGPAASGA